MSIGDLPPELLEVIFTHCVSGPVLYPKTRCDVPLNVSQTCKQWREVSLNISLLWSTFEVVVDYSSSSPPETVINRFLDLSKAHPLTLSVVTRRPELKTTRAEQGRVESVMELLLRHLHRWRAVSLDLQSRAPPASVHAALTSQGAPLLERLELSPSSWSPPSPAVGFTIPWLAHVISGDRSPNLRSLTMHRGQLPPQYLSHVPWGQLTYLRLEAQLSELACLSVLQSSPALEECHLLDVRHQLQSVLPGFDPLLPVLMPRLAALKLASQHGVERLIRLLVAPALQSLELGTRSITMRWDHAQFMRFLARSGCALRTLSLRDLFVSRLAHAEIAAVLLRVSPSLTALSIASDIPGTPVPIDNSFLRALAYPAAGGADPVLLCPWLERLELQLGPFVTHGELEHMISSRLAGHRIAPDVIGELRAVEIVTVTERQMKEVERIRDSTLFTGLWVVRQINVTALGGMIPRNA